MWPDITDPQEIKKRIAVSGIQHAEQQERHENLLADLFARQEYMNMVGQQNSYSVDELLRSMSASTDESPIIEV
jgi:hypothetical protein